MTLEKTTLGVLIAIGSLTSGCVVDGDYVHAVAPAQTVVAPAVVVPARPWHHGPRFWGHRHHHHHGRHH